jgi:hypothetical protein
MSSNRISYCLRLASARSDKNKPELAADNERWEFAKSARATKVASRLAGYVVGRAAEIDPNQL